MRPPQRLVRYAVGDEVEVIGKDAGFFGSYYEAAVISVQNDGRYQIQYKTLIEDEETNIPLKEVVLPKDLRPVPPRVKTRGVYEMNQSVDVFDNDGWWYGKINGKINGAEGIVYDVYFSSTNEVLPYHSSRIRVHHDFNDSQWIIRPIDR